MSERVNRSVAMVLPGLLLAMFLGAIDLTIMAPALPAVAQDLGGLDQIPSLAQQHYADDRCGEAQRPEVIDRQPIGGTW